jgi:hypothetical protein
MELDALKPGRIGVRVTPSGLSVDAEDRADVIVALTEDALQTDVKRGENKGRTLTHAAVVREMVTMGEAAEGVDLRSEIKMASDWQRPQLKAVAFIQERKSRRILATAVTKLE